MPDLVITPYKSMWKVTIGDKWEELTFDEALGVCASYLLGQEPRYLRTQENHDQWNKKYGFTKIEEDVAK